MNKKPVATSLTALKGTISVAEVLRYLRQDCYLSKQRAAEYLGLKVRDLDEVLPPHLKFQVGRRVLYRKSELDQWMEGNRAGRNIRALESITDDVIRKIRSKAI